MVKIVYHVYFIIKKETDLNVLMCKNAQDIFFSEKSKSQNSIYYTAYLHKENKYIGVCVCMDNVWKDTQ